MRLLPKLLSLLSFLLCLLLSHYSTGQQTIAGTYKKSITDLKRFPVSGSPYRYKGVTEHKLILRKDKTFLYRTHHKASEWRNHFKKGKVYNYKTVTKSKYKGEWSIQNDSLILIEKQLDSLVLFKYEVDDFIYLCLFKNAQGSDKIKGFFIPPCFCRKKKMKFKN
jgi:hypothetical protein